LFIFPVETLGTPFDIPQVLSLLQKSYSIMKPFPLKKSTLQDTQDLHNMIAAFEA
jgi:hypothetical protein